MLRLRVCEGGFASWGEREEREGGNGGVFCLGVLVAAQTWNRRGETKLGCLALFTNAFVRVASIRRTVPLPLDAKCEVPE